MSDGAQEKPAQPVSPRRISAVLGESIEQIEKVGSGKHLALKLKCARRLAILD
jgi:hypothetical protein